VDAVDFIDLAELVAGAPWSSFGGVCANAKEAAPEDSVMLTNIRAILEVFVMA